MSKIQIQKFIENDELDLSLQNLSEIPAKEISKYNKVKSLDLSCNVLETITPNIGLLTNIRRLDLSKNKIQSLPEDIGKLINLEYLDLRANKLTNLPLSMVNLKKLKWLDLKNNPLNPNLSKAAGDCLDKTKCEKCAVNVLEFLNVSMSKSIKKNEKKKRKEEELLRQKALEEEKQREQKKLEKAEQRLKRRIEMEAEKERKLLEDNPKDSNNTFENNIIKDKIPHLQSNRLTNFIYHLFICGLFIFGLILGVLFFLVLCNQNSSKLGTNVVLWCRRIDQNLPASLQILRDWLQKYVSGPF